MLDEYSSESAGGPVSIVRIIAVFAKEHCTPIPMVMELEWHFFLALLADMNRRAKEQNDQMQAATRKMKGARGMNG